MLVFFQVSSPAVLVRKTVCNRLINLAYYCGGEKVLSKIGVMESTCI